MKKSILLLALFLSMSIIVVSCKDSKKDQEAEQTELGVEKADLALNDVYQCPMDCENGKTYDEEGACPVCKMTLKKAEKEEETDSEPDAHDHDKDPVEQTEGE
ncbi:MAG: hypothetical protein KAJ28_08360 [Flavobacteriaceae bacterium]|nr:hypothetical protein [Flavobacteriaceae bacterium]